MKPLSLLFILVLGSVTANAQEASLPPTTGLKIVFQCSSSDTLVHRSLIRQLNNVLRVAPETQIEVVCHGPGIQLLHIDQTRCADDLAALSDQNVTFLACQFTMSERKIPREKIIKSALTVHSAIVHIVGRQEQGWQYIKAGF